MGNIKFLSAFLLSISLLIATPSVFSEEKKTEIEEVKEYHLSIIIHSDELIDGNYLTDEEYITYEYIANGVINSDIEDNDKKDILNFLKLTRFMIQIDTRHKELKELATIMFKNDKSTSLKISQLILAEQGTLSNEVLDFVNSTGLSNDKEKLTERIIFLETVLDTAFKNIDEKSLNEFANRK